MSARVAWLMPARNAEHTIREAIESIRVQTYGEWVLFVCNDGSIDATGEIIDEYARDDARIIAVHHHVSCGVSQTRNELLARVPHGIPYVACLDADDRALPGRLTMQTQFLDDHPLYSGVGSAVALINEEGTPFGVRSVPQQVTSELRSFLIRNPLVQSALLLRTDAIKKAGEYDPSLTYAEDYDLWLRMCAYGMQFFNHKEVLTEYRVHSTQGRTAHSRAHVAGGIRVRLRYVFSKTYFSAYALMGLCGALVYFAIPACARERLYRALST